MVFSGSRISSIPIVSSIVRCIGLTARAIICLTPACFLFSRSTKYQASHHKETIDPENTTEVNGDHHSKDSAQTTGAGCEMEINALPAVSKEPQITAKSDEPCGKDLTGSEELEVPERQEQSDARPPSGDVSVARQECSVLGNKDSEEHQTEGLVAPEPHALEEEKGLRKTEAADEKAEDPSQQNESTTAVPPEKARRFTVDRLRQLGVDVFGKPQLGADRDSFVILEEPETNRGNSLNWGELL